MTEAQRLVDAGTLMAKIATPSRDLAEFGADFAEIALTLQLIGKGLGDVYERHDHDDAPAHRKARDTALRTAKCALVDLARLIGEMEMRQRGGR